MSKQFYLLLLMMGCLFCSIHFVSAQAFINRQGPITSSEVFGIRRSVTLLPFPNYFGGMYVETKNSPLGKPFYGYAIDSIAKAYHYYDGGAGVGTCIIQQSSFRHGLIPWLTRLRPGTGCCIQGTSTFQGATTINNQLTSQDIKFNDLNPFIKFQQSGVSKYYFQYQNTNDEFILHETGTGPVLKIKDGEVFFPQLTGLAGKS